MTEPKLLTRDEFRRAVFERDHGECVCCGTPAVDAHHIMERRLFPDGGYYMTNGASVCSVHHLECERTTISVEDIRRAAAITKPILPSHLYRDQSYDKWGNPILQNGQRLRGELFYDESVQKVLREGGVLNLFTHWVKYPRTHHLPWSPGMHDDDRQMESVDQFVGREVVVTEKMDGENTTLYLDHIHARSVDSSNHPSRNWVKSFWGQIRGDIPEGWRICGENLYAKHSIRYDRLPSYFLGFSVWNNRNICLSWDETLEWFGLLGIVPARTMYRGQFDERAIRQLHSGAADNPIEGYVLRLTDAFDYGNFRNCVGKFVRNNHIHTTRHWMHGQPIEPNGLFMVEI